MAGAGADEYLAHLEQKKKEVAAVQEAAEVAREQALALLRLQRRIQEIDAMANDTTGQGSASVGVTAYPDSVTPAGDAVPRAASGHGNSGATASQHIQPRIAATGHNSSVPQPTSSLSKEDRRRFGLEPDPGAPVVSAAPALGAKTQDIVGTPPRWSSLSAEDRQRFGLDGTSAASAPSAYGRRMPETRQVANSEFVGCRVPAIPVPAAFEHDPAMLWGSSSSAPSMSRTLAQLQAVGATRHLQELQETERQLQLMKMRG